MKIILASLAAVSAVALASAASAQQVTVEAKSVVSDKSTDYGAFRLRATGASYWNSQAGVEVETFQANHNGVVVTNVSGVATRDYVATLVPVLKKVTFTGGVELGDSIQPGTNNLFYGVEGSAAYALAPKVTLTAGYRLREGFGNKFSEQRRFQASGAYQVLPNTSVSLNYYRDHTALTNWHADGDTNEFGVSVSHKF